MAEPLVAPVNVTVGPNPGTQSLVFVATQLDSLYAFNVTTGQLVWHDQFSSFPARRRSPRPNWTSREAGSSARR